MGFGNFVLVVVVDQKDFVWLSTQHQTDLGLRVEQGDRRGWQLVAQMDLPEGTELEHQRDLLQVLVGQIAQKDLQLQVEVMVDLVVQMD